MQSGERAGLRTLEAALRRAGATVTLVLPGAEPVRIGDAPDLTVVTVHSPAAFRLFRRMRPAALAEAYCDGLIDVDGDPREVLKLTDLLDNAPGWLVRAAFGLQLHLPGRRWRNRRAVGSHYDRHPDFFLPWLERWRSYSHGLYVTTHDDPATAQARKMQLAIDALALVPGMDVFDMGSGWGCFVEYAGLRGIRVHAITISHEQYRFVADLIRERGLPCSVELIDFLDYEPSLRFDGAVFMGTLEHLPDYRPVPRFLSRHLKPEARVYADFCAQRGTGPFGAFLRRHVWPGPVACVNVQRLTRTLIAAGFNIHQLHDDTRSYACTVRDWANALDRARNELAARWGERPVRTFALFLRGSQYFFETNRTQAYHLVAGKRSRPLDG